MSFATSFSIYESPEKEEFWAKRTIKIPACRFYCGCRPCSCEYEYKEYRQLEERYKRGFPNSVKGIIEEMDKGEKYLTPKSF
jgi:hypothetical protein